MASFKQLDRNNWQVSFYCKDYLNNNKKYKKSGFATKKEAKEYSENFIALHVGASDVLFLDAWNDFLENKKLTCKKNTIKTYENATKKFNEHFIDTKINELDTRTIFIFLNTYINTPKTQLALKKMLLQLLKYCKLHFNLKNIPEIVYNKKKGEKTEKAILTLSEFNSFIDKVENPLYKLIYSLLYFTGCRLGELSALLNEDIDLEKKSININKTRISAYLTNTPKTKSSKRVVSIPNLVIEPLKTYLDSLIIRSGFIFPTNNAIQKNFSALKSKGYIKSDITIHGFRHSHVSYLIQNNIPITAISKRLGHANPNITMALYSHFYDTGKDEIIELLNKL